MILLSTDHHHHNYSAFSTLNEHGLSSRLQESLDIEDWLHSFMIQHRVTTHIRLGDLFEKKNIVDAVVYSEVMKRVKKNKDWGIEEVILSGNHDQAQGETRSTLEPLQISNLATIISEPTYLTIEGLRFCIVPYMGAAKSHKEALGYLADRYSAIDDKFLLGHFGIHGAKTGSEFILREYLHTEDLFLEQYNYGFFGHIHEPQNITGNSMYIGSFSQRSFADEGSPRRVILLDNKGDIQEHRLPGPRFHTYNLKKNKQLPNLNPNDYYSIAVGTDVDVKQLHTDLVGKCKGFVIKPDGSVEESTNVLMAQHPNWYDTIQDHAKRLHPKYGQEKVTKRVDKVFSDVRE